MLSSSSILRNFVDDVQQRANLESYEEAHQLSRATVEALGDAISGGEAAQLANWLPAELGDELAQRGGHARGFDKRNFLEKVGGSVYSVDLDQVESQASAVLHVLRDTAPTSETDKVLAQLPPDLSAMFA